MITQPLMKVMSLDYGTKNIGIAIGNTLTKTTQPLLVMKNADYPQQLIPLILKEEIDILIIGIPCYADGNSHTMTEQCTNFARYLQKNIPKKIPHRNIIIHLIDERFSSVEAENLMKKNNQKSIHKKVPQLQQLDAWAAMVLMEQFFNEQRI